MRKHVDALCFFTFAAVIATFPLRGAAAVKLTAVSFPDAIRNGSVADVVLDCEYSVDEQDRQPGKLPVVKWFFNGDPQPVYQWIPPDQRPQDLGVLKGRLNLGYRATRDRSTMHRALQILNPTTELSGEYMCQISTFDDEQTLAKKMIIFEPEKTFEIMSIKENDNSAVNITCIAEGVFPQPQLTITSDIGEMEQEVFKVMRDGAFDVATSVLLDDDLLPSPTQFDCELQIPEANYTKKTGLLYHPANGAPPRSSSQHAWLVLMAACLLCYRL
ncbi:uncharacterized protein LOC134535038 isoform X2 [Bacillus rossius redtenbacheri]|uniref:uncharacterized protein LOC134535038 isoform X2 n=1 Tax=Bacillus rossius redtenbacheri TaxID=93214 RepID=UPI002FDCF481